MSENVKMTVQQFADLCEGDNSPIDAVVVCRCPDGSVRCFAPDGDGLAQIGLLHAAIFLMANNVIGGRNAPEVQTALAPEPQSSLIIDLAPG